MRGGAPPPGPLPAPPPRGEGESPSDEPAARFDASPGRALAKAAAEWAVTHTVRAGRWEVRYRVAGEGPPLVLVHGLACSSDYWVRNGAWLAAAGFRVYAQDLPGFGMTDGPRVLSVTSQAKAAAEFAEAVGIGPAAYVGHSLSCQTVLELAATRPTLVSRLVLAAPTGDRRRKRLLREAFGFARDLPREPAALVPLIGSSYLRAGPIRMLATWISGKRHDTFGAAARTGAPTLVLVGDRDPVVSLPFARALAGTVPGGRLQVVPGAAHAIIYDAAHAFNAAVVAFLRAS